MARTLPAEKGFTLMRFSRKALGSDPLQSSLIPMDSHEPTALFGDTAQPTDRVRLGGQLGQQKQV